MSEEIHLRARPWLAAKIERYRRELGLATRQETIEAIIAAAHEPKDLGRNCQGSR